MTETKNIRVEGSKERHGKESIRSSFCEIIKAKRKEIKRKKQ